MAPVSSPCLQLCTIDPHSGLCQGCGRTLAEIAAWGTMTEAERHAVMDRLPARSAAAARRIGDPLPA